MGATVRSTGAPTAVGAAQHVLDLALGRLFSVVLVLGLVGCGGRTAGVWWDAGGSPDGGVDAAPATDGWVPPDPGPEGCWLDAGMTTVYEEGAPAFAQSLARMPAEPGAGWPTRYLLGGMTGWQDHQGSLWMLDQDDLHVVRQVSVGPGYVFADYDWHHDEVVVVNEDDNQVQLRRYLAGPDLELSPLGTTTICQDCAASWSRPLVGAEGVAVAVEDYVADTVRLVVVHREPVATLAGPDVPGANPFLVHSPDGPVLVYEQGGLLMVLKHYWDGTVENGEATVLLFEPLRGLLIAQSDQAEPWSPDSVPRDAFAAVLLDGTDPPAFRLLRWDTEQLHVWQEYDVAEVAPYPLRFSLAHSFNHVGVTWGELEGEGRVGAHFLGFSTFSGNRIFGPELISEPITHTTVSYAVWSVAATHPQGYAVVWGGWHPSSNYALYGRILRCNAWHETPPW